MAWFMRCLLLSLSLVILSLGSFPPRASGMGLPPPPPTVNFSIGVQGMVWCKSCRFKGYTKSMDASPLPGAVAFLRCRHGRRGMSLRGVTDKNGYFLIQTSLLTSFTSQDCKVYVLRSPVRACNVFIYPGGKGGSPIKFEQFLKLSNGLQALYSAGNFMFAPRYPNKC